LRKGWDVSQTYRSDTVFVTSWYLKRLSLRMLVLSKVSACCFKEFVEVGACSPEQDRTNGWTSGGAARCTNFQGELRPHCNNRKYDIGTRRYPHAK